VAVVVQTLVVVVVQVVIELQLGLLAEGRAQKVH
jgi:hypothetical protein